MKHSQKHLKKLKCSYLTGKKCEFEAEGFADKEVKESLLRHIHEKHPDLILLTNQIHQLKVMDRLLK